MNNAGTGIRKWELHIRCENCGSLIYVNEERARYRKFSPWLFLLVFKIHDYFVRCSKEDCKCINSIDVKYLPPHVLALAHQKYEKENSYYAKNDPGSHIRGPY